MAEKIPSETEFLRKELHVLLKGRYGNMTIVETVGTLDMVKMDLWEQLRNLNSDSENNDGS